MIGDSHLAMMVNAHKAEPISGMDITAVPVPRQLCDQVSLHETVLQADGSDLISYWDQAGLSSKIDLSTFDQVVFISYTATAFHVFFLLRDYAVSGWKGAKPVAKALNSRLGNPDRRRLLTRAVLRHCLVGTIQEKQTYQFVKELRNHSAIPIVVVPAPFLAEHTLRHRPRLLGLKVVLSKNDGAALAEALDDSHEMAFGQFENVFVLWQPKETVVQGCLTAQSYREGASRYGSDIAHGNDDVLHAGPKYGRLILNEINLLTCSDEC